MADELSQEGDALILKLDPGGPISLDGLTDSFSALARMYERHYRENPDKEPAPKLYVTRLETGSIIAQIRPFVPFITEIIPYISVVNTVANFSKRLSDGIKAFAGISASDSAIRPNHDDAADLRAFVKPLTGRKGASLGIRHARFARRDKNGETVAEYTFDENEINRAALNMERALELAHEQPEKSSRLLTEVMLVFYRASRTAGKDKGKAADWAIVSDVIDKPLPTYFKKSVQGDLKDKMVRGDTNPLTKIGYIVDLSVQMVGGKPSAYIVTAVHDSVPLTAPED
jgi:hypothetical protein